MVSEGVRELLWSHLKENGREMTVGGDEGEIKYPLSPMVTLRRVTLQPSPNSKEWKTVLLAIWWMDKEVLGKI
jgi:hypothetical protein